MNKCKKCNIYISDIEKNCPLCGAASKPSDEKMDLKFVNCDYYDVEPKKPARLIVRNIFIGLSILILAIMSVVSGIIQDPFYFVWSLIVVSFIWFSVLRFIFWPDHYRVLLSRLSFTLCLEVLLLGLFCSFYIKIKNQNLFPIQYLMALFVVFTYVLPSIILATHITFLFIAAIRKSWYEMAFSVLFMSFFEIIIMVISCCLYYLKIVTVLRPYYPILVGMLGTVSIIAAWTFKPRVTLEEVKKRFFF